MNGSMRLKDTALEVSVLRIGCSHGALLGVKIGYLLLTMLGSKKGLNNLFL
jgi:hypothetical protein